MGAVYRKVSSVYGKTSVYTLDEECGRKSLFIKVSMKKNDILYKAAIINVIF